MKRTLFFLLLLSNLHVIPLESQPRFKGKRLDTTQAVLGNDTTLKKLIEFKDSLTKVGPAEEGSLKPEPPDSTWMGVLIVGAALLIVWTGRRAWLRQRK